MNLQGHADPYRTSPPPLSPTDYRVLVYALVAAVTAALVFAGIALSLALARTPATAAPSPVTAPAPVAEAPACPTVVASPVVVPALAKVRLNSEPDGATVSEDGVELCSSTPCEITYKGSDAEPARSHPLTVARAGFRTETVPVTVTASPILVKLRPVPAAPRPRSSPGSSTTLLF
jgi:hypothetical protein